MKCSIQPRRDGREKRAVEYILGKIYDLSER